MERLRELVELEKALCAYNKFKTIKYIVYKYHEPSKTHEYVVLDKRGNELFTSCALDRLSALDQLLVSLYKDTRYLLDSEKDYVYNIRENSKERK